MSASIFKTLTNQLLLSGGVHGIVIVSQPNLVTTNATPTLYWSYTLPAASCISAFFILNAQQSDGSNQFNEISWASARRQAGTAVLSKALTIISGGINTFPVTRPSYAVAVSSNDIQMTVTGKAATTVEWSCLIAYDFNT